MIRIMSQALFDHILTRTGPSRHLPEGAVLARRGDPVTALHLLMSGAVNMTRDQPNGGRLTLHRAEAGAILAEASIFHDVYHCDLGVVRAAELRSMPAPLARKLLSGPEGAPLLVRHLAASLQGARTRAEILALPRLADRLAAWQAMNGPLPPRGQWRGLAADLGVTPEALYRALARRRSPEGLVTAPDTGQDRR
ncbi:Crp/Fnr family transcriptional regulator [Jannaschia pohangensis]|uniref:cAMP-binding domain of CRP or a regulatory subunit of cAMP-dependent protein kinases n=1 Tax=Jannaschia pohangensis TaxID=390807 RepID=A0A1I3UB23_9RHOB|nr:Crp/Fnr family transcriptional regulator [Jannaschia pohangensis]SFJ80748.1 cAMP-binding domain of CRP or a regulatory subunit of cAMP-dependent protein kinases [Jannaschia pohangensis]